MTTTLGWIIANGDTLEVRVSSNGNLVSCADGACCYGKERDTQQWPTVYANKEAAVQALIDRQNHCAHDWRMLSHEERGCVRCGAIEFTPDM